MCTYQYLYPIVTPPCCLTIPIPVRSAKKGAYPPVNLRLTAANEDWTRSEPAECLAKLDDPQLEASRAKENDPGLSVSTLTFKENFQDTVCARAFFKAFVDHQIYIHMCIYIYIYVCVCVVLQFFPPILDKFPMHVGFLMAHVQGGQHTSGLPVASCPHNSIIWMILGSPSLFRNPRCNLKSSRWVRFTDYINI